MKKKSLTFFVILFFSILFSACNTREFNTITFDANGGTGEGIDPIVVYINDEITIPQHSLTRSGYVFLGWMDIEAVPPPPYGFTDRVGIDHDYIPDNVFFLHENDTLFTMGNQTLYAAWGKPISSLTFDNNIENIISSGNWTYAHEVTSLDLSSDGYNDLTNSGIENLRQLYSLNLNSNNISDLAFVNDLNYLRELRINNNSISDLSSLTDLISLEALYLANNSIINVTPLSSLTSMRYLDLQNNSITTGVTSLSSMIWSDWIELTGNPGIPASDLTSLRAALTNTIVYSD